MCPVIDLVELTASALACAPNTALIALVSLASLNGVEVPWPLTYPMSSPPIPGGVIAASAPPVIMASVSPTTIDFHASPMACALVAQAETGDQLGPLALYLMEISPGAMLMIIWMMKKGESRSKPFSSPFL